MPSRPTKKRPKKSLKINAEGEPLTFVELRDELIKSVDDMGNKAEIIKQLKESEKKEKALGNIYVPLPELANILTAYYSVDKTPPVTFLKKYANMMAEHIVTERMRFFKRAQ